jgi:GNAT superfamily N-acetyltransferase
MQDHRDDRRTNSIRFVRREDVPGVVALVRDVLAEFELRFGEGATTDEEITRLPGSYERAGGAFWVAVNDSDGEIVGTCGVFPVGPGTYELRKMYLRAATRGHGLGQRLLDESVGWVRAQGGTRMVLDTIHEMKRAIAFYESNGFVRDDTQIRGARCSRGYARDL